MRKNLYEAFTLVEMLIVMGILIILMAVGITAGRFAINRANTVAHQNAADQIYTALQAYYTDHREFPNATTAYTPKSLIGTSTTKGPLFDYLDQGSFNGGSDATYMYFVGNLNQSVLVCVSLGGESDAKHQGFYCTGNGFNDAQLTVGAGTGASITAKKIAYDASGTGVYKTLSDGCATSVASGWASSAWK